MKQGDIELLKHIAVEIRVVAATNRVYGLSQLILIGAVLLT